MSAGDGAATGALAGVVSAAIMAGGTILVARQARKAQEPNDRTIEGEAAELAVNMTRQVVEDQARENERLKGLLAECRSEGLAWYTELVKLRRDFGALAYVANRLRDLVRTNGGTVPPELEEVKTD